jgi:hypothetical protein
MESGAMEPFYLPLDGLEGSTFEATHSASGPWFATSQHVGPPTALLMRAVERCAPRAELQLTRLTVEVLGPVPLGAVEVRAEVVRTGRAIELVGAEMLAGGRAVLSARAWRCAVGDTAAVAGPEPAPPPPPDGVPAMTERPPGWLPGYMDAMEWRWASGAIDEPGDATVWMRQLVPLVAGEEPSPLQRLAAVVDSGNGVSSRVDMTRWLFVNTELTVHVHRQPAGEWICLDATTVIGPTGAGTATSRVFDRSGHVAQGAQALLVRPR